ncbi:hypothetical protein GGR56DRAFT_677009 [Xylariaceae sp. FL0804]|nr:hypothetical protein GGR56DRAFT_677009 [Xylariaceae sp. FL0804]
MRNNTAAITAAGSWNLLEEQECVAEYNCHGLRKYGDMYLVVDKAGGWLHNVIPGSNSLALSAACHCSSTSYAMAGAREEGAARGHPPPDTLRLDLPPSPYMPPLWAPSPMTDEDHGGGDALGALGGSIELRNVRSKESVLSASSRGDDAGYKDDDDDEDAYRYSGDAEGARAPRGKILWGVVRMPPEWYGEYVGYGRPVGHLAFGVEEDNVTDPVPGDFYA